MNFTDGEEKKELIPTEIRDRIESQVTTMVSGTAVALEIHTETECENAVSLTQQVKKLWKEMEDERDALVRPLNARVKEINDWFKARQEKLKGVETIAKKGIGDFQREQENIRAEAQRKADEEARKERERQEALARAQREKEEAARREQERIEKERRDAEDRARREREEGERRAREAKNAEERKRIEEENAAMRKVADERRKLLDAEATASRRKADAAAAKAQERESQAISVVAQVIEAPTKAKDVSTTAKWTGELVDLKVLVTHCLQAGQLNFIQADMKAIEKVLQATKGAMALPGIKVTKSEQVAVRTAG